MLAGNQGKKDVLEPVSSLPSEIQLLIAQFCLPNMTISLLVAEENTRLFHFQCSQARSHLQQVVPGPCIAGEVSNLSACFRDFSSRSYISALQHHHPATVDIKTRMKTIQLYEAAISGVKFAGGRHGIRALKVLYTDVSDSPWLGDEVGSWIGSMRSSRITKLSLEQDVSLISLSPLMNDLRLIKILRV